MTSRYMSMVVLPYEEYLELKQPQQQHKSSSPLEKKYEKVLQQYRKHSHIHNPIEQQFKQGEDLTELRLLREKMNTYYFKDEKQRGSQLLSKLSPGLLDFNHAGEIIDKRTNQTISGSRIDDLIKHAVSADTNAHTRSPQGWKEFVSILKAAPHIPTHWLNSHTLQEVNASLPSSPLPSPISSPPVSPPAPQSKKRKSDTPAHLHCPRTRLKAKRTQESEEAAKLLLEIHPSRNSSGYRKF